MNGASPQAALGRRTAFVLLLCTSAQALFLTPDFPLVPGERTNLFTGLLCGLSLAGAWLFTPGARERLRCPAGLVSLALLLLGGLSIFQTTLLAGTAAPFYRGSVALAAGLGGYWCGRILLSEPPWRERFAWFCLAGLAALMLYALWCYLHTDNVQMLTIGSGKHPLANRILLLWFAPLLLMATGRGRALVAGSLVLLLSYAVLYLTRLRTAVLMPLVLAPLGGMLGLLSRRWTLVLVLCCALAAGGYFALFPEKLQQITRSDREEVYYRVESYPFSWHIAKQQPWFGIGLRTERGPWLADYTLAWPHVSEQRFRESLEKIVTSENSFLTLMVGLGLPFTLLYTGALALCLGRMALRVTQLPSARRLPLAALLLTLAAGLLYLLLYDGLLYPEVSWFFHLLLGMAAGDAVNQDSPAATTAPTP